MLKNLNLFTISLPFYMLKKTVGLTPNHKFKFKNPLYSIDSSSIDLAMIFYLIVSFIKFQTKTTLSILEFTRIIRATLFERVALMNLLSLRYKDIWKIKENINQSQLKLAL